MHILAIAIVYTKNQHHCLNDADLVANAHLLLLEAVAKVLVRGRLRSALCRFILNRRAFAPPPPRAGPAPPSRPPRCPALLRCSALPRAALCPSLLSATPLYSRRSGRRGSAF